MRKLVFIALVSILWSTPSIGQDKSLPRDYIAKQEQMLREVEQRGMDAAKDGKKSAQFADLLKQLGQLIEESESADGVEPENRRHFWNSSLSFLFEGQAEAAQDYSCLVTVLAETQECRAVDPLQWKIVDVHLKRIAAAEENRKTAESRFDVGFQGLDLLQPAIEECCDARVRFCDSLLDTMPPVEEKLNKRLRIASRIDAARDAYHHSLAVWSNIRYRFQLQLPGGSPELETASRVHSYRWQARLYELQWELKKLRNGTSAAGS